MTQQVTARQTTGINAEVQAALDALVLGTGAVRVIGETPSGLVNGSNATYTTAFSFIPLSVEVFVNGLRQKLVTHYNTSGTTIITFSDSPQTGDQILINYGRP